ncbi:Putative periplasmic ATP /GTP-binding protein [hydrothermal vent metagenome]|uniref:Putative periplasmic ATP /GTP-binding protein n=1 Tax=hydrothermal vent metagenome TaxID=652676 RepID=A0A1W1EK22_9ZZZZ
MSYKVAFSMIELIMVIVVIGILSSMVIPRFKRDIRQNAIDSIRSDILYTKQLALLDDKHNIDDVRWQRTYWKWRYTLCSDSDKVFYSVSSDMNEKGNVNRSESAIDASNGKYLYQSNYFCREGATPHKDDSPRVIISEEFGIKSIINGGDCRGDVQSIAFDNFGRPHRGVESYASPNYEFMLKKNCSFTFTFFDEDIKPFTIVIEAITGRIFIGGDEGN